MTMRSVTLAGEVRMIAHRASLEDELSSLSLSLLAISTIHLEAGDALARKERLMKTRSWIVGLLMIGVLLLGALSLLAQDGTAVPTAVVLTEAPPEATVEPPTAVLPPSTETPEDILGLVLATLFAGAATISGSVFVTAVVGVLKMIIPASVISGDMLKNVTSLIVWLLYSVAIKFGLGTQFQGIAAFIAPILVTAAPLVGVLIGSAKLYLASKAHHVPVLGYQRPSSLSTAYNPDVRAGRG